MRYFPEEINFSFETTQSCIWGMNCNASRPHTFIHFLHVYLHWNIKDFVKYVLLNIKRNILLYLCALLMLKCDKKKNWKGIIGVNPLQTDAVITSVNNV